MNRRMAGFFAFEGSFNKRRQRIHERNCVYNLFNELKLHDIRFQGTYFDYKLSRIEELHSLATADSIEKHSDHARSPRHFSRLLSCASAKKLFRKRFTEV